MNEIFAKSNQFGKPKASKEINDIKTEVYSTNIGPDQDIVFPFRARVNGNNENFEIVSNYIDADNLLSEQTPDPDSAFNIIY